MTTPDQTQSDQATDYDSLPYLSLPIAYTQPSRLAAVATLHGLQSFPAPDQARVLELGCASGGNLAPLAARWPKARFVGVDLSAQQIADGQKRIKFFGLDNIELRQADLADLKLPAQSFDYVICHGVFSWVPPAVQEAILRLIGGCLSDNGIAAISYNVAPGWHLRSPVREILRHRAGEGPPQERVARARAALEEMGKYCGSGAYGALMRAEAKLLEKIPASYILGEFLAEHNHAISFSDFANSAARHGLDFIGEAEFDAEVLAALTPEGAQHVARLAQSDRARAAQELDFLSGRPFRRTLLRRRAETRPAAPSAAYIDKLHISALLRPDSSAKDDQAFIDRRGRQIVARTPIVGALFKQLGASYPASLSTDALFDAAGSERERVAKVLWRLIASGRATVSVSPTFVGRATDARPKAWRFARAEAALGLPGVTSLHHVAVALPKVGALIASKADGTRTKPELAEWLAAEMVAGRAPSALHEQAPQDAATTRELAESRVAATLDDLEASAVLAP